MTKKFSNYDPVFKEQGIDYVCAAGVAGTGVQSLTFTMVTGGVVNFAAQGIANMDNATYQVLCQNQTDAADEATIGSKTATGFVITGPDNDDVLDLVIVGRIAGQQV